MKKIVYTAGTSTQEPEEFFELLNAYGIKRVIDVRRFPTSSRFPHFKRENLMHSLPERGIDYIYLGDKLGGYRSGGYEVYMETNGFRKGLDDLERLASETPSAFFCAEKLFWRCHRRFIADRLIKRGWEVRHIIEKDKVMKGKVFEGSDPLRKAR